MSIAKEILSLRRDQTSSVSLLLGAIEWQRATQNDSMMLMRGHAVVQAVDLVLLNVAVHALETKDEPYLPENRRMVTVARRRRRRSDLGVLLQRQQKLFA